MGDTRLGGRVRTRISAEVRARHRPCRLCGYRIDQTLKRTGKRHPLCSVVDEWIPRNPCRRRHCHWGCDPHTRPGPVTLENCVELHDACNSLKSNHWPVTQDLRDRCRDRVDALLAANTGRSELERTW